MIRFSRIALVVITTILVCLGVLFIVFFKDETKEVESKVIDTLNQVPDDLAPKFADYPAQILVPKANFGGHHFINEERCGSSCQRWSIENLKTGKTVEVPFVTENGALFVTESNLIIENPPRYTSDSFFDTAITRYWLWDGSTFTQISAFEVEKNGQLVATSTKGNHSVPEWQWTEDCTVVVETDMTVCR